MTDDEFWSATDQLKLIHQWARASYVAPWALILAVLLRVIASTGPKVMLPGPPAPASLNMGLVLIGRSGAGKGVTDKLSRVLWSADIHEEGLGSGQGIHELYKEQKNPEDRITRALISVSEIDHLTALNAGQGNNTRAALKAGLTGDRLGSKGASSATTRVVPADSYRLCLSISAQFGHTGVLMDDVTGGTPQRLLWAPVTDPDMPDEPGPTPDDVLDAKLPSWSMADDKVVLIQYGPPEIREYINAGLLANGRGEGDALDAHRTLVRCKVAAALAILDHRMVVSTLDWELSEHIMAKSDATRTAVLEYDRQAARAKVRDRAMSRAAGEQFVSDHKLERAKKAILRWLERDGQLARHDLRRKLKADLRDHFDPAIAELAAEGVIAETSVKNGVGYGLSGEGTRVPEVHPPNPQLSDRVPEVHGVPDATVTDLDSRRSNDSERPKLSCQKWLNQHVEQLRAAGHVTIESFAVIEAGQVLGYTKGSIHQAVSAHPDMRTVDRKRGRAIWSITPDYKPPRYESADAWLDGWLDNQGSDTVDPNDAKIAGEAAGHNWDSVRRAAGRMARIESVPAHGEARTERIWKIVDANREDAS
ncbi:hypothetical protein [Mycolicibacterium fortuitum]|uniref:hypothetical protein n=1 Tax=Mycolicibacterium fortuitum TaxID=1766 RepID=UPI0007EAE21F|nr:hypothetical protein [Mycolicibacterium fortuitum]OBB35256.1 hypothetical protein A5763_00405 [Mycolicibacterium fortuitum]OBB41711.1 hypothetical protein A5754_16750 [Mycolicibacterium fortuitum]OBB63170.1 hypothetical protein A5755_21900 [Mycolicibacterium fortuitum]OBF87192.1 hypothetical protein A5751_07495 [Mycolicibacterium fortuitum]